MRLKVGKIVNTHGLKGELKVITTSDFLEERFVEGVKLLITRGNQVLREVIVEKSRFHKNFCLVKFKDIDDINEAEIYKNTQLKIDSEYLSELDDDEFYYYEIIDCKVYDENNIYLGTIIEILQTGANDVWVIKNNDKEYLIPYIDDVVKKIDIKNKIVEIEVMEGLLN